MKKIKYKHLNAIKEKMINDKGFKKRGMNKGKYLRKLMAKVHYFIMTNKLVNNDFDYFNLLTILQEGIIKDANLIRKRRAKIEKMTLSEIIKETDAKDNALKSTKFKKRK